MKKFLVFLGALFIIFSGQTQTVIFHENFELPSLADSVTATGNPAWGISIRLMHSGLRSDTSKVAANDSTFLTTSAFSTVGNSYVILQFSHICKIEFFDNAIIQVSNNNGASWTQLTASQYMGTGQFAANGNKFTSTSYADWVPGTPSAVPTNTWWKTESFDISSLAANSSQVKVRFKLSDGNGTGAAGNYGWLIDDIKVTMNLSELIPPVISLLPPNYSGTVYSLGPYLVKAKITDNSGVDTAKIFYTVNGGALNAVGMNVTGTDTFSAYIPAVNHLDTICYYVYAEDASPNHNSAQAPTSGCNSFTASAGITFPYYDNFDGFSNWSDTAAAAATSWELGTPSFGLTNSAHSAPNAWDVNLTTAYGSSANATLISPVFDFSSAVNATLAFWQNRYCETGWDGTRLEYTTDGMNWQLLGTVGDPLAVNWYTSSSINSSGLPAWEGNSNGWIKSEYLLSLLDNTVGPVQFRFIFTSDGSVQYDGFSIDDFSIVLPSPQDAGITSVISPEMPGCAEGTPQLSVVFKNFGTQNIVGPFNISYQTDGNTPVTEQYTGTVIPGSSDTMTFTTPISVSGGAHSIKIYTSLAGDGNLYNDTLSSTFVISTVHSIPYTNPLDSASDFAEFCTTTGMFGTVQLLPAAANTGTAGALFGSSASSGWTTYAPDTLITSLNYIWLPDINADQYAMASFVVNSAGYSNLKLKFDAKLFYLYSNIYTNFRVLVNGVQVSPHLSPNLTNTPYNTYEYELSAFLPAATLTIEFESKNYYPVNTSPNGNSIYLDNVMVFEPPPQEAAMISINAPKSGCGLGQEIVKVDIKNAGSASINGGLNANYKVLGSGTTVTEAVSATILPGDTLQYDFTTLLDMTVTNSDSTFIIEAWVDLAGDPFQTNDTAVAIAVSHYVPPAPGVNNVSIPYGTSTTLYATSQDTVFWYDTPTSQNTLGVGSSFTTPLLYGNTIYYAEAAPFAAGLETIIGTSTGTQPYVPCYGYYDYAWSGTIYLSSELNFMGRIDTIAFYVSNSVTYQMLNQSIYMTETSNSFFATADPLSPSGMTQVFAGSINWNGPGWYKIPLQTPFEYGGTDNLLVYWENHDGSYASGYPSFYSTSTTVGNMAIYDYQDSSFPTTTGNFSITRPNIKFIHTAKSCSSDRVPDTVFVTGIPACDVGVLSIETPISGIELSDAEVVKIRVKNYGTASQSNIPVHYSIDGGTAVNEVIAGPVASGDTVSYTFTTTADLSAYATYSINAYTSLACDITLQNDTVSKGVTNGPMVYCESEAYYPTSYEDIGNVTFSSINNGNPLPTTFNTTAINAYSDFTALPPAILLSGMSFPISVSVISSSNFYNTYVKVFIDYNRDGAFDMVTETAFEGDATSLSPTITGSVTVPFGAVTGKYIRMRVVAAESGSTATVEPCASYSYGETEDYFVYILPLIANDAGITDIIQPAATENEAAVVPVKVVVRNFGTDTIYNSDNMEIVYAVNGGTDVSALYTGGPLAPAETDTVTLSSITVSPGFNSICAYTVLAGDSNTLNDQYCKQFYGEPLFDAGVIEIIQPAATVAANTSQPVEVVFMNMGITPITSMDIAYKVNGGAAVSQSWTGSLAPGAQDTIILPTYTVPSGVFNICSYTILTSDGDPTNDTSCVSSFGLTKVYLPYFDNFDGTTIDWYEEVIASGTQWELGTPAWGVTDSAYSAPNAWDVNLTSAYSTLAECYLYTQIFSFDNVYDAYMSFWQNRNTETGYDGVRIDYTTDGGSSWNVLGTTSSPLAVNWYTEPSLSSSGLPAWDGLSNGWIKSEYVLSELNNLPDVQFRFAFSSDGSIEYDGFSLDDFRIDAQAYTDAGISKIVLPTGTTTSIALTTVQATIKNYGLTVLTSVPVAYVVNGADSVTETWTGTLQPGDSADYTFTQQYLPPAMSFYAFCVKTKHADDTIASNNKKCKQFYTDVSIAEIDENTFYLEQNIPNPTSGLTNISFYIPENGEATFYVMNAVGQSMYRKKLKAAAGEHLIEMDISEWNSGVYYYILEFNGSRLYRKMVITR